VVYLVTTLLQIFRRMCWLNAFQNPSIFGEDSQKFADNFFGPLCASSIVSVRHNEL